MCHIMDDYLVAMSQIKVGAHCNDIIMLSRILPLSSKVYLST
jgi:hypothetical protein